MVHKLKKTSNYKHVLARKLAGWPGSSKRFGPPRGYVDSIKELNDQEITFAMELKRSRKVEHNIQHLNGYPELEAEIRKSFLTINEPSQNLYLLPDARVLGQHYFHPLISNQDRFVLDQAAYELRQGSHPAHYALKLPRPKKIDGVTFSLVSRWSDNYWHWLFDCLGKWLLLKKKKHIGIPEITHYAGLNLKKYPFKQQSLTALGLQEKSIVDIEEKSHFLFKKLIVGDLPSKIPYPEIDTIQVLREAFLITDVKKESYPKKIYISRGKSASRLVQNEMEFEYELNKLGFEKIHLEGMNILDQVKLFRDAEMIFSQHGAGLTNIVFSNPKTRIFELFEPDFVNPCYAILASKLGLNYNIILNGSGALAKPGFHWKNIPLKVKIDCRVIRNAIQKM